MTCVLCGSRAMSTAACPSGHYVCDACHAARGVDVIERLCAASSSTDPVALATELMRSPAIAMHGPEHHYLVAAVLLTALDNAQGQRERKPADLAEARRRAAKVLGGFCGTHGSCGAAVGTGIFWSITTGATPLSEGCWGQSNRITARALFSIAEHGGPRCCKRDTYLALAEAVAEVETFTPGVAWTASTPRCEHSERNRQCLGERCPFHAGARAK